MILETTFLIDLERELHCGEAGPAQRFLEAQAGSTLYITSTIAGELAAGMSPGRRTPWEDFLRPFEILPRTVDVCWEYGQAHRYLSANGLLIGANDLWIGATALAFDKPVVTRNTCDFGRIPNVRVLDYCG